MRDTKNDSNVLVADPCFLVRVVMLAAAVLLLVFGPVALFATESEEQTASYIVKGKTLDAARAAIAAAGGTVTHELGIIKSVGADLTASQAEAVRQASLKVLERRREADESTHPFYWAGFVAAGDWR